MSFGGFIITNNGRNELAKAQAGTALTFGKVVLGSGSYAGSYNDITSVVTPVVELAITKVYTNESECIVECDFLNDTIETGFYLREIGIYANNILYCYDNAGNDAEYIYPAGSAVVKQKRMRFILNVSASANVTLYTAEGLYATYEDLTTVDTKIGTLSSLTTTIKTSIVNAINWIVTQLDLKAPTSHASTATTYGIGSASNYGHTKATGATPSANGNAAVGTDNGLYARGDHVHPLQTSVSGNAGTATVLATARTINGVSFDGSANITVYDSTKAPISHASTATTYGVGTSSNYGHVKATSATPSANGTAAVGTDNALYARGDHVHPLQTTVSGNAGTATILATARTINGVSFNGSANITVYDSTKAPISHASAATTYGVGTEASYGHTKTINNVVATAYVDGEALSAYQGKVLQDEVDALNRDIETVNSNQTINYGTCTTYSATVTYALNSLVIYGNRLYRCTTAITVAEAWTASHWTAITDTNNGTVYNTTDTSFYGIRGADSVAKKLGDAPKTASGCGNIYNNVNDGWSYLNYSLVNDTNSEKLFVLAANTNYPYSDQTYVSAATNGGVVLSYAQSSSASVSLIKVPANTTSVATLAIYSNHSGYGKYVYGAYARLNS